MSKLRVVTWGQGWREKWIELGLKKFWEAVEIFGILIDCGNGFTDVEICQNSSDCTLYGHTLIYCALLRFTDIVFFTIYRFMAALHQASLLALFSNSTCSLCVSVSHFGNSCNISNFFMIIIFVMVICDQ